MKFNASKCLGLAATCVIPIASAGIATGLINLALKMPEIIKKGTEISNSIGGLFNTYNNISNIMQAVEMPQEEVVNLEDLPTN